MLSKKIGRSQRWGIRVPSNDLSTTVPLYGGQKTKAMIETINLVRNTPDELTIKIS
jgi:hypothetical protein